MQNIVFSKNKFFIVVFLYICACAVSSFLGGTYYYGFLIFLSFLFVLLQKKKNIYNNGLYILVIAILSTIINYPSTPDVFRPIDRIIILIIVMIGCGLIF